MDGKKEEIKVYFNPFAFTTEQNNEFLSEGYEVMPMSIPDDKEMRKP